MDPTGWTDEHADALRDLDALGLSHQQIAELLRVEVGEIARRLAVPPPPAPPPRTGRPAHNSAGAWNDDNAGELARLWNEGLSIRQIGKALGLSKNAVVGKVHRLGLPARPSPLRRPPLRLGKAARVAATDGEARGCRWPLWANDAPRPTHEYCGARRVEERPYCAEHCRVAYVPLPRRVRRAADEGGMAGKPGPKISAFRLRAVG